MGTFTGSGSVGPGIGGGCTRLGGYGSGRRRADDDADGDRAQRELIEGVAGLASIGSGGGEAKTGEKAAGNRGSATVDVVLIRRNTRQQ